MSSLPVVGDRNQAGTTQGERLTEGRMAAMPQVAISRMPLVVAVVLAETVETAQARFLVPVARVPLRPSRGPPCSTGVGAAVVRMARGQAARSVPRARLGPEVWGEVAREVR